MPIKVRSPFVLDYSPSKLRSILSGLEHILAECPDYVREDSDSEPVLSFMQELSDALKTQPEDPEKYWDRIMSLSEYRPTPPETEEQKKLRIWNLASPTERE